MILVAVGWLIEDARFLSFCSFSEKSYGNAGSDGVNSLAFERVVRSGKGVVRDVVTASHVYAVCKAEQTP